MSSMVFNQNNQVDTAVNSVQLLGVIKAIVPRSFEKTFDGMPTEVINHAMKICIDGLTREQINHGLTQLRDNGFCPDLAMFRKWCLGITGFGTEQQRVQDTFKGKNAALAHLVKWLADSKTVLTNAEKEAYDRSYEMFGGLDYSSNYERKEYQAYASFKENYDEVVREFAENGIVQSDWNPPITIAKSNPVAQQQPTDENRKTAPMPDTLKALAKGVYKERAA